ncbi:unnamed protein product [Brassicogethes aeneus]|uniref:RNase H type-1 domain-containing protein n=1 Tax=Brassicogethes aeneus TaxID=1431903 RepID=A0A9P0AWL6_BRAAE|nr:unnamed protein product [Brassicogethes aeneus]
MTANLPIVCVFNGFFSRIIPRFLNFSFKNIMEDAKSLQVSALERRLDEAERRAGLLAREIKAIRYKINQLRSLPSLSSSASTTARTTETATTSNFIDLSNTLACSTSGVRRQAESNGTENVVNKRAKLSENSDKVIVYVDGACENNGKLNAKAGFGVWFGHGDERNISKPVNGRPTNNTAEIQACIAAIECCLQKGQKNIHIKTDSEFTINCMTKWIKGWKKKNWKKANGEPVINKTDLETLDKLCAQSNVQWEHVRGHRGIEGNEEADKLARLGAQNYKPN